MSDRRATRTHSNRRRSVTTHDYALGLLRRAVTQLREDGRMRAADVLERVVEQLAR
jgi:hypothetical protein